VPAFKQKRDIQINNPMMYLKPLEKQGKIKPKTSRWREIVRLRSMRLIPKELYKESMKEKVRSLKRLIRAINP
jgi:hypothetical protein